MFLSKLFGRLTEPTRPSSTWRFPYLQRQAGEWVDHDRALQFAAVYDAIRIIAEDIAKLPWQVFQHRRNGGRERRAGSQTELLLSRRPNQEMSAMAFRETLTAHALGWGNGYAEIETDLAGRPRALWLMPPDRVECVRDRESGRLLYEVTGSTQGTVTLSQDQVFHLHGLGFDGLTGYSVVSLAARSIGGGLAAETYSNAFFANGVVTSGVLEAAGTVSDESRKLLKEQVAEQSRGQRAFSPLFLPQGITWKAMNLPAEDAQLLEQRKFSVTEIARWFRLPPHKLADLEKATFSNIEQQSTEYVIDTLLPWCVRLEQEADWKLFGWNDNVSYTKLNLRSLLRADSTARAQYYKEMINMGVFSPNMVLELEDMDGIGPAGDKHVMQLNMTTLERIGEEPAAQQPAPAPANPPSSSPTAGTSHENPRAWQDR